jgi:glycosyltransferase involved in cell wall biosynthesis
MAGISFIVPFYNAESRIKETVYSFVNLIIGSQFDIQVIFVDNNSTDNSVEIIENILLQNSREGFSYTVVSEAKSGRIHALKKGLGYAFNEIICHVDDDNRLSPRFAIEMWDYYNSNLDIMACGALGLAVTDSGIDFPDWFERNKFSFAVGNPIGPSSVINPENDWVYGACFSYRKSILAKLDLCEFEYVLTGRSGNNLLSGEDMEFLLVLLLLNYKVGFNPNLVFNHYIPAERLSISYLNKLNFGFGLASPFIGIYRAGLINNRFYSLIRSSRILYIFYQCLSFVVQKISLNPSLQQSLKLISIKGSILGAFEHSDKWEACLKNRNSLLTSFSS